MVSAVVAVQRRTALVARPGEALQAEYGLNFYLKVR